VRKTNKINVEPGTGSLPPESGPGENHGSIRSLDNEESEPRQEILKRLGNRLIEVRAKLGLKQNIFAKELGVSPSYLSDIELGKTRPSFDFLLSCHSRYKINLTWLLVGDGPMFLEREPGKKLCEYDFGDQGEFMHEMMGKMEKSKFCRNVLAAGMLRAYYENEAIIKRDLDKESGKPG
jgi:transcriptional regulator with XRE-family HTH domain